MARFIRLFSASNERRDVNIDQIQYLELHNETTHIYFNNSYIIVRESYNDVLMRIDEALA